MIKEHQGYIRITEYLQRNGIESEVVQSELAPYVVAYASDDVVVIKDMRDAIDMVGKQR